MRRNGRPVDPDFAPDEGLFLRVHPTNLDHDYPTGPRVKLLAIRLPDQSVNREKYGPADWLLLPRGRYPGHAVVAFPVSDLPSDIQNNIGVPFAVRPEHIPLEENYPHSVLRVLKSGEPLRHDYKISTNLKRRLRDRIACSAVLVIEPGQVDVRDP